jgi:hypothetical protein
MTIRKYLTARTILILLILLSAVLLVAGYLALRRPPRDQMERYVPATTLAYIEVSSLGDLVDGLTSTRVWEEMAPALGMSSQLSHVGSAADIVGRLGIGPDEAVLAGRGQFAFAMTGLDAESRATSEEAEIHFKPRFALVIQTHSTPEVAARLVRESAGTAARYLYGDSVREEQREYQGVELRVFHRPDSDRQLFTAATGTLVVIANHDTAIKACLDAIAGRVQQLADDQTLRSHRSAVDRDAAVVAFVTGSGCEKLAQLGPALFASRFTTDPDRIQAAANLFGHMSKQAVQGLLYGSQFTSDGVTDRYLTILTPQVAAAVADSLKAGPQPRPQSLELVPRNISDFTVLNVHQVGALPERTLKTLNPRLDLVAGLALRELVIGFRKRLGLEPSESLGGALGDELTIVRFNDTEPIVMLMKVRAREEVIGPLVRYLQQGGSVTILHHKGVEISASSNPDQRAAAFIGDYLVLGTGPQLQLIVDAHESGATVAGDDRLFRVVGSTLPGSILSCRPDATDAARMMLSFSELTRATDGAPDLLETESIRRVLERIPPSVSVTQFREDGIYTESTSAAGNFTLAASLSR